MNLICETIIEKTLDMDIGIFMIQAIEMGKVIVKTPTARTIIGKIDHISRNHCRTPDISHGRWEKGLDGNESLVP